MKIAVTGGSGFIGKRLIAHLQKQGHEVINISRSPRAVVEHVRTVTWEQLRTDSSAFEDWMPL